MSSATILSYLPSNRKVCSVPMPWHRDGSKDRSRILLLDIQGLSVVEPAETLLVTKGPSTNSETGQRLFCNIQKLMLIICFLSTSLTSSAQIFRAPSLEGKTLSGIPADSAFTSGKLTMLSFFYIGCMPCMKEIPVLNRLKNHFAGRPFQIVAVAPHSTRQLRDWNTPENTGTYRTEPIRYEILPECSDSLDKPGFSPICYTLSRRFGVNAYPTSVFIGPTGALLMNVEGFPLRDNQDETLQELIRTVEEFLKKR